MIKIHETVKDSSNKDESIENFVKKISKKFRLLFIDEMHIFNIVDALIIKNILLFIEIQNF